MKRVIRSLAVLALVLGLVAPPASADPGIDTMVVEFSGTATVCAQDNNPAVNGVASGCPYTKSDGSQTGRNGLYIIGQPGKNGPTDDSKWQQRTGNYKFASDPGACQSISRFGVKACALALEGKLAPVAGIGAACGFSHGHSGNGSFFLANGSAYRLSNVGWPVDVGGTLPVTGTYQLTTVGAGKGKSNGNNGKRIGPIAGVVQVQGGAACFKDPLTNRGPGSSAFTVIGVVSHL